MKEEAENLIQDIKDLMYNDLKVKHDYWGESSILEMLDFCNRNNLHLQRKILLKLLKPNVIK